MSCAICVASLVAVTWLDRKDLSGISEQQQKQEQQIKAPGKTSGISESEFACMMCDFMVNTAVLCALVYICATSSYFTYCMLCKWRRKSTSCLHCTHCQQTLSCVIGSDTVKISFDALTYLCVAPSGAFTRTCPLTRCTEIFILQGLRGRPDSFNCHWEDTWQVYQDRDMRVRAQFQSLSCLGLSWLVKGMNN